MLCKQKTYFHSKNTLNDSQKKYFYLNFHNHINTISDLDAQQFFAGSATLDFVQDFLIKLDIQTANWK